MAKINTGLNVELNSCLVTKFDSGRAGLRLHDDNEDEMLDDFHETNPAANDVEKLIFSFGTNDIKHLNHGVNSYGRHVSPESYSLAKRGIQNLRDPIVQLIKKAKHYFPGACVFVQCTLPMRNLYWYTATNMIEFNSLLKSVCQSFNCYFIDCFNRFLSHDMRDHNRNLFNGYLHLNRWGYNVLQKWLRMVVSTNSNSFNTVIDSLG